MARLTTTLLHRSNRRAKHLRPAAALAAISSHMSNGFFSRFASSSGTSLPPPATALSCAAIWIAVGSAGGDIPSAAAVIGSGCAISLGIEMPLFLAIPAMNPARYCFWSSVKTGSCGIASDIGGNMIAATQQSACQPPGPRRHSRLLFGPVVATGRRVGRRTPRFVNYPLAV